MHPPSWDEWRYRKTWYVWFSSKMTRLRNGLVLSFCSRLKEATWELYVASFERKSYVLWKFSRWHRRSYISSKLYSVNANHWLSNYTRLPCHVQNLPVPDFGTRIHIFKSIAQLVSYCWCRHESYFVVHIFAVSWRECFPFPTFYLTWPGSPSQETRDESSGASAFGRSIK
jgi:hypothetical protein